MSNDKAAPDLSDAVKAARDLLGWKFVHVTSEGTTSGYIVETEAYTQDDPASHSFRGVTNRNRIMFGRAGLAYVYFTYGMHYCVNIVTGGKDNGQAVLLRALEPVDGIKLMKKRRHKDTESELTNGPAKLVQAMGITSSDNGKDLISSNKLFIKPGFKPKSIYQTTRVGIREGVDKKWRFYIKDNPFIS